MKSILMWLLCAVARKFGFVRISETRREYVCDECGDKSIYLDGSYGIDYEAMEEYAMQNGWGGSAKHGVEKLTCGHCMAKKFREYAAKQRST